MVPETRGYVQVSEEEKFGERFPPWLQDPELLLGRLAAFSELTFWVGCCGSSVLQIVGEFALQRGAGVEVHPRPLLVSLWDLKLRQGHYQRRDVLSFTTLWR